LESKRKYILNTGFPSFFGTFDFFVCGCEIGEIDSPFMISYLAYIKKKKSHCGKKKQNNTKPMRHCGRLVL